MKNLFYCVLGTVLFLGSACDDSKDSVTPQPDKLSFFVTGYPKSAAFTSNGREEGADEIRNLSITLLDEESNVIFEKRYYSDFYLDGATEIPDTAFFPSLGPGTYTVILATIDVWYDQFEMRFWGLDPYVVSNGPIFIGVKEFDLTQDQQQVNIDMQHLSSRVTVKVADGAELKDEHVYINFETEDANRFDVRVLDGELDIREYHDPYDNYSSFGVELGTYYAWTPQGEEVMRTVTERTAYVLPRSIQRIFIDYSTMDGSVWSHSTRQLETDLALATGDAITIVVDMKAFSGESIGGIMDIGEIVWNDLGEVTVP